jgi:hypothetical protein
MSTHKIGETAMSTLRLEAPPDVAKDYFHLFVNRRAYTLQSNQPRRESARHYYYRPKDKKTGQGLSLKPDTIRRHLEGEITIGLYAINPPPSARSGWPSTRIMGIRFQTSCNSASA